MRSQAVAAMSDKLVEWQEIDGATVKLGRFRRAQLYLARYEDGRVAVTYVLPERDVRIEIAESPWLPPGLSK